MAIQRTPIPQDKQNEILKDLTDTQKITLRDALADGIIYLGDDPATTEVETSEITDDSLKTLLGQFDTDKNKVIDGRDFNPVAKYDAPDRSLIPEGDGTGATDLFKNAPSGTNWKEVQPGVFVNINTKQIYFGDNSSGNISLSEILKAANITDAKDYTVILDDDNGNAAKITIDAGINELIVDNDMLSGSGEAKSEVIFSGNGKVNSIWNDVDAVKGDINTSITGLNANVTIKMTNDLDITEDVAAKDSSTTKIKEYKINRTLETQDPNAKVTVTTDNLNIKGTITTKGDPNSKITNATFGNNVKVNVADNRNFTSDKNTKIDLDVKMIIDGVYVDSASANSLNAGNIFKLNLDSKGTKEVTYEITGKVNQELKNSKLGDKEEPPPPPPPCDPYNILEINVEDSAKVSKDKSSVNIARTQLMDGIEIGEGVSGTGTKGSMPFVNGTYIDKTFFGSHTTVTGEQKVANVNNKSTKANAEIRNENIWLDNGEDSAKYLGMSLDDIKKLAADKFFSGGSQVITNITGKHVAINNGKEVSQGGAPGGGTADWQAILAKMRKVFGANDTFANVAGQDNSISQTEFQTALRNKGITAQELTDAEIAALYAHFAGTDNAMNQTEWNTFTTALTQSGSNGAAPGN